MKTLKQGESGNKSTVASGNIVECDHQTAHKSLPKGSRFQVKWFIDLTNLSPAQIAEAASEHFIIKIRRPFANEDKPKNNDWNNVTFDAKDYLTARVSKVDKAAKLIAGFSDEQLAEMGLTRKF